jgi:hypothetical protein
MGEVSMSAEAMDEMSVSAEATDEASAGSDDPADGDFGPAGSHAEWESAKD